MPKNGTNALLHRYMKEIEKNLPCSADDRKQVLATLKDSVSTYLLEFPEATFEDITQHFGTPAQIADAFLDTEEKSRSRERNSLFKKIMLCILIIVAFATLALGAIYVTDMHSFFHGHYNDTVAYGTPPPPESGVRLF